MIGGATEYTSTISEELIENRENIGNQRRTKHNMFKKVLCRFYASCLDEDECFFAHEKPIFEKSSPFCPRGQTCSDQACKFSESNHKNFNEFNTNLKEIANKNSLLSSMKFQGRLSLGKAMKMEEKHRK